ncbi:DMT family transporter [Rhodospirillaceae bacterium KN72]|uniref:DMT family transporter n=1 Tax=Pacificispira spongiicola TaxID=2729598 RepID=A0A7Y0HF76_9PROT|nr:DMT family transporter [Pacificispira spongiicola]NMM42954.1 DMT family transporter [Pacificispira spongiicola]
MRMSALDWGMLVTLSILWGGSFFFNQVALEDLPPFTVVFGRIFLAALILWGVILLRGLAVPRIPVIWLSFLGMAILNNAIPFSLLAWGQTHISSSLAAILNATTPLFGVVVAHVLTSDERATPAKVFGVLAGFGGVAIMIGVDALADIGIDILAQLACLGAATSYAFSSIFGRRFKRLGLTPMVTAAGQVTVSSMILLPLVLIVDRPWTLPMPGSDTILSILGIATLSTALAYILFFRILSSAGATNLMLVTFLIPVSAILLGVLFLGEALAARHVIGMAGIGIGLAAIDGRLLDRLRKPKFS